MYDLSHGIDLVGTEKELIEVANAILVLAYNNRNLLNNSINNAKHENEYVRYLLQEVLKKMEENNDTKSNY